MHKRVALILLLLLALPARAHIGSPDTFVQANAGPYKFLITAHPPAFYPGALELDLRLNPDDHITTATASLDGGQTTPIQIFDAGTATASIWLPTASAHNLHILVQGSAYDLALPPAAPSPTPETSRNQSRSALGWTLACLLVISSGIRVALRRKGPSRNVSMWQAALFSISCCVAIILLWKVFSARNTTAPQTVLQANLASNGTLDFTLTNSAESFSDLVPDHGKLLHLFLIRQPQQDVFLHLHPRQLAPGHFSVQLPAMPPGTYRLFADFYHAPGGNLANARNETATITLDLPAQFHPSSAADPDDTIAVLPPNIGVPHSIEEPEGMRYTYGLRDGYTLQLVSPAAIQPLHANLFQVTLLDPSSHSPADMALYLNMPAHVVVVRNDNAVFAHIHPGGTQPMLTPTSGMPDMPDMSGMWMPQPATTAHLSNTATIPYGFPSAGHYRLFVQMKHGSIVETGAFNIDLN